jgi:hypothetical protein
MSVSEACENLIERQRHRIFCIRQQQRCDRSIEALLARSSGYHTSLVPAERKALFSAAAKLRREIEGGKIDQFPANSDLPRLVIASAASRATWDQLRGDVEKRMIKLARALPAISFVHAVRGFGELGLAVIVGEAGDLGNYANPAKLWKRLGLAVFDGHRQGSPGEGATKDDWIRHGYNRQRRAEVWVFCSDVLFRAQWRGAKDDAPAHPIGPYGEAYAERKAWVLARGWTPAHADADARRYMTKRLLRDLWRAWRDAGSDLEPRLRVHPAEDTPRAAA